MDILNKHPAAEYNAATDRINVALAKLKNDLTDMRNQDVTLMRQLININETIQNISKRKPNYRKTKRITSVCEIPSCALRTSNTYPSLRRQSAPLPNFTPLHNTNSGSLSSIEDECSSVDDLSSSCSSESDFEDRLSDCVSTMNVKDLVKISRDNSPLMHINESVTDSDGYEFILKTNVKLWKQSIKEHRRNSCESSDTDSECGDVIMC